jgi:hypothetical protein
MVELIAACTILSISSSGGDAIDADNLRVDVLLLADERRCGAATSGGDCEPGAHGNIGGDVLPCSMGGGNMMPSPCEPIEDADCRPGGGPGETDLRESCASAATLVGVTDADDGRLRSDA